MKKSTAFSVLLIGITAMTAQIVLIREFIIVFYGNEISVGFILANWLLLGSFGSLILGSLADKIKRKIDLFVYSQVFLSIMLPLSLILIRLIKKVLGIIPGEMIGFGSMVLSSFVILSPVCIVLGFLFALACRVYSLNDSATQIGRVYILESIGATIGGLLYSYFLIKYIGSLEIIAGLSILNIAGSFFLSAEIIRFGLKRLLRSTIFIWLVVMLVILINGDFQRLDKRLAELEWNPLKLISSRNSIYGNIAITKRDSQTSFFSNGLHNFTVPDELAQEEVVHFAMLEHRRPEEILLIGGGLGGPIWETLKYPIKRVDYVELDPLIVEMGERYLADSTYFVKDNPRVNIIHTDGRLWVKNSLKSYDVAIINLPSPFTAQLNRFYTMEFFQELRRAMKPQAVLSFGVCSSENYISAELGKFLGSIHNTLEAVFPDVKIIPGDTAYFLASNRKGLLNLNYASLSRRLKKRGVETRFVREYYLFSKLSPERINYIQRTLKKNAASQINLDFKPISYYYNMLLWSAHFKGSLKKILLFLTESKIWAGFGMIYLLLAGILRKRLRGSKRPILIAIGTTGFSEIAFEIAVVLAFQVIYGFVYYKLGLILTSFMAGLTLGSFYITKKLYKLRDSLSVFIKIQAAIVIYPLLLPPIFLSLSGQTSGVLSWLGSNIIFPALPAIAGFIGGLQFPLGAKIYLGKTKQPAKAGGITYGVDLIGACIGAVTISSLLVPVLGIFKTCAAVSLLNLCVFALLLTAKKDIAGGVDKP